jgi:hypothetical protein
MKSIKIILSIVGFAVTGLCCGPLFSQNNSDILFYTAYYNTGESRMEHRIFELPPTNLAGDHFNSPVLSRTYFVPIDYNDIEPWMSRPFEDNYWEEELQVESWMTSPFENSYYEEDLQIESWMTSPFENTYLEEDIEVELWMTRPFENSMAEAEELMEEELPVEDWMTKPFKAI